MHDYFTVVRVDQNAALEIMTEEQAALDRVGGRIVGCDCIDEEDIIAAAAHADILTTNLLPIPARVIRSLPRCKAIIRRGIGYDDVDVDCATECGVMVMNIPDFCMEELSNHAIALMLASAKKIPMLDQLLRNADWNFAKTQQAPMAAIHGETLGIIGCGRAGRCVARKAAAFGMQVIGYDKYAPPEVIRDAGIEPVPLSMLLQQADYVTLHIGLTEETFHLIDREALALMKPSATLINTSRGANVDEAALIDALVKKQIAGACLDVFENEPLSKNNPLIRMEEVILTPHSASYSDAAFRLLRQKAGEEEVRIALGQRPVHLVNPQVLQKIK